jgi:hypothetical protein
MTIGKGSAHAYIMHSSDNQAEPCVGMLTAEPTCAFFLPERDRAHLLVIKRIICKVATNNSYVAVSVLVFSYKIPCPKMLEQFFSPASGKMPFSPQIINVSVLVTTSPYTTVSILSAQP